MSIITLAPGGLFELDPDEARVVLFDWDSQNLAVGATIVTSTWTLTTVRPSTATALTTDTDSIGATNRTTQIRVSAGTVGALYQLTNRIVTDEVPAQTKERSVFIQVAQQ